MLASPTSGFFLNLSLIHSSVGVAIAVVKPVDQAEGEEVLAAVRPPWATGPALDRVAASARVIGTLWTS